MSARAPRLLIFDFDGTLADTFPEITEALNRARKQLDWPPVDPSTIRRWIGYGLRHFMFEALPPEYRSDEQVERFTRTYKAIYAELAYESPRLFAGMEEVLDRVSRDRLAIISNKSIEQLSPMLDRLGIGDRFFTIVGGNSLSVKKPNRGVYDHVVAHVEAKPSEVWMIGDSEPDIELGVKVGARTVGCLWGLRERNDLEAVGADYLVDSPAELGQLLAPR